MSRPFRRRATVPLVTGSGRQLRPTATATSVHDRTTRAGPHPGSEAVLLGATALVGLEGALHGEAPRWWMVGGHATGRGAVTARRIMVTTGSGGCRSATKPGRMEGGSVPSRSRIGQPEARTDALWTSSCGAVSPRCTVPDRPSGSRPGTHGEHATTTGDPATMTRRVHLADAPDVDDGPSPPRPRPCASGRDSCTVHTCGRTCGNRC